MNRLLKYMVVLISAVAVLTIITFFGARYYFTAQAEDKAHMILSSITESQGRESHDKRLIAITQKVYDRFQPQEPSNVLALRFRPYLTNVRLPHSIRLEEGVIETLSETGLCDNAARYLHFLLKQEGYSSVQWNMVTNSRAHSVLNVQLPDGRNALLDPLYGAVAYDKDTQQLLSPEEVRRRISNGDPVEDVFLTFDSQSDLSFYRGASETIFMGAQGRPLYIDVSLPVLNETSLFLGQINGNDDDVYTAGARHDMTPFWHYMGHKYDRSWVRTLRAPQDMRVAMTLVSPVEAGVVTASPVPEVQGNTMTWVLDKGDKITFTDGKANISWARLNSYLGVDQIALHP